MDWKLFRTNIILLLALLGGAGAPPLAAAGLSGVFDTGIEIPSRHAKELQHARADHWRMTGRTIMVRGNVYIPYGNMIIRADQAMIDLESRDLEAKGHVRMIAVVKKNAVLTLDELERLQQQPGAVVEITGTEVDPLGERKIRVSVSYEGSSMEAERVSGNLATGMLHFTDLRVRTKSFVGKAKRGTRQPGGELKLEDLELSSCVYLNEDQSHFSIGLATANLYPHETEGYGFSFGEKDHDEYSLWGYNGTLRLFGVPVLWLPMFYKPKEESPGLFSVQMGQNSSWGYYLLFSRRFDFSETLGAGARLHLDWYSSRGLGYGVTSWASTATSRTLIRAYGIYDLEPYKDSGLERGKTGNGERWDIPHQRFDFQITHLTHISPRLDFRAQVEWLSDAYMLQDYFEGRANTMSQPASYAALEYQANRFSASLYTRFQTNYFSTTVQKLPEFRLDLQRQEILPGTNLYYQGSHTADFLSMKWADFDRRLRNPASELDDYLSGRFDSVNFLYYPLRTSFINIVPRIGLRLTGYTNSAKHKVNEEDLFRMQLASNFERDYGLPVNNYDDRGGAKLRLAMEVGVEANTKIYRTWENVRNAFWELDGLRHVAEPYINYTFIPEPTVSRDHLLYFDDIDRIDEQNFIRFGLRNRLQTRSGGFTDNGIREWFSMENYWDIHFNNEKGYNHIGDFCTKLSFSPNRHFTFTGFIQIDAGQNQDHDVEAIRGDRLAGRPGIGGSLLNRAYFSMQYKPIEDIIFNLSYNYQDGCVGRAPFSMGSFLTEIESGSAFDRYYVLNRSQTVNFGMSMPLTPDRKTYGAYNIAYDFEEGGISRQTLGISRLFHCVKVSAIFSWRRRRNSSNKVKSDASVAVTATLVGLEDPLKAIRRSSVESFTGLK